MAINLASRTLITSFPLPSETTKGPAVCNGQDLIGLILSRVIFESPGLLPGEWSAGRGNHSPTRKALPMSTICREFLTGIRIGCRILIPARAALLVLAVMR